MWYVIQTITGREEELIAMMDTILERGLYQECFVIRGERMKRLGGQWQRQIAPLFPGYVFVDAQRPEVLFQALKRVPKFARIIGNGRFEFTPVNEQERLLLERLMRASENGKTHLIRCSFVETSGDGKIVKLHGALRYFAREIVRIDLHKRIAVVRIRLLGQERTMALGIWLRQDGV